MLKLQGKAKGDGDSKTKGNNCILDKNLGFPVGLTQGTYNQNEMHVHESVTTSLSLASCWYAYAFSYIKSPVLWTTKDINNILVAAKIMIPAVSQIRENSDDETKQGHTIFIQDNAIELELPLQAEVIGNIFNANRPQVNNIIKGFKRFFRRSNRACLFRSNAVQLLVWKTSGVLFVFDPMGRNETCCRDNEKGFASLICLESIKNVACLVSTLSDLKPEEFYVLNAIRVKSLIKTKEKFNEPVVPIKINHDEGSFNILSEKMAILNGSVNIANNCFKETRNFQTLTSCCCAYVYSLIRPPNTWTSKTVDKVLLFGSQLYDGCIQQELPEQFSIRNIPPMINIATYRASLRISPYQNGGRMLYALDHTFSELMKALSQYLLDHNCVLLQVDQIYLTVWMREKVYYLFDPYARNQIGETILGKDGAACVHMHSTLESLCSILYANLMRIAEKERFYLHGLESSIVTESGDVSDVDRTSLNESVGSLFTPQLTCIGPETEKFMCNLDSPSVSATQFIRPWHMMKGDAFERTTETINASESESSTSVSTESEFSFESDNSQIIKPNNDLGLDDSIYDDLRKIGLSDDEIVAYQDMGISTKDMKKWAALGLSPVDVKRLRDADIEMDEFKSMQKMGLTVDDCIKARELKITLKQFAKMKKLGVKSEEMLDYLENKANTSKFRELSLNQCEIDKLSAVGVSAEEYDNASKQGMSFEEVIYANKHDIPVDEFVRQKSMDMTAVDIIKAKEMDMTPEEYKQMMDVDLEKGKPLGVEEVEFIEEKSILEKPENREPAKPDFVKKEAIEKILEPTSTEKTKEPEKPKEADLSNLEVLPMKEEENKKEVVKNQENIPAKSKVSDVPTEKEILYIEEEINDKRESINNLENTKNTDADKTYKIEENISQAGNVGPSNVPKQIIGDQTLGASESFTEIKSDIESLQHPPAEPNLLDVKPSTNAVPLQIQPVWLAERPKQIGVKRNMAVVKSSTLSPRSFQKLFTESFKLVDRVLVLNPENEPSCVAFRNMQGPPPPDQQYFLYEGCACNMDQIRRLDIASSKRYLTRFPTMNTMIGRVIERMTPPEPIITTAAVAEKRHVASYARELLDDKLNLINEQFNSLLKEFHSLSLEK